MKNAEVKKRDVVLKVIDDVKLHHMQLFFVSSYDFEATL